MIYSLACTTALLVGGGADAAVFDWTYDVSLNPYPGTVGVPLLSNASGNELTTFLAGQPIPAVRVTGPLSTSTAATFLDGPTALSFILGGIENPGAGGDALTVVQVENLVFQTTGTASAGANISQYALDPYHPDATNPNPASGLSDAAYTFTGVNTASPSLFPGSSRFRSPGSATSSAPNILSSLFTLPIIRLSEVSLAVPAGDQLIPFVSRFNSLGSPLVNSEFDGIPAYETTSQLLSQGDYQALMTHYRMRGADGVIAHRGGVVGYERAEFLDDTVAGWSMLDDIYASELDPITLDTTGFEANGVAWSGVIGETPSGQQFATLLLSNLRDISDVTFNAVTEFDGTPVALYDTTHRTVEAGEHRLLTFSLINGEWQLLGSGETFVLENDGNGGIGVGYALNDVGTPIPEPGSLALLVSAGMALIRRRR